MRQARRDEGAEPGQDAHIGSGEGAARKIARPAIGRLFRQPARMLDASQDVFGFTQEDAAGVG